MIITLKVSPKVLHKFEPAAPVEAEPKQVVKEESPSKESSSTLFHPVPIAVASSNDENPTESTPNTPIPSGTPVPSLMLPPTEGVKKKGVKRSAGPALGPDGLPKPRGKPGPKKKARL
jgi:hypothetical protein